MLPAWDAWRVPRDSTVRYRLRPESAGRADLHARFPPPPVRPPDQLERVSHRSAGVPHCGERVPQRPGRASHCSAGVPHRSVRGPQRSAPIPHCPARAASCLLATPALTDDMPHRSAPFQHRSPATPHTIPRDPQRPARVECRRVGPAHDRTLAAQRLVMVARPLMRAAQRPARSRRPDRRGSRAAAGPGSDGVRPPVTWIRAELPAVLGGGHSAGECPPRRTLRGQSVDTSIRATRSAQAATRLRDESGIR